MKTILLIITSISLTSCMVTTDNNGSTNAKLDSKTVITLAKILSEK